MVDDRRSQNWPMERQRPLIEDPIDLQLASSSHLSHCSFFFSPSPQGYSDSYCLSPFSLHPFILKTHLCIFLPYFGLFFSYDLSLQSSASYSGFTINHFKILAVSGRGQFLLRNLWCPWYWYRQCPKGEHLYFISSITCGSEPYTVSHHRLSSD